MGSRPLPEHSRSDAFNESAEGLAAGVGAADVVASSPLGIVDDREVLLAHSEMSSLVTPGAAEHVVFHAVDCGDVLRPV